MQDDSGAPGYRVVDSEQVYAGAIVAVRRDTVAMPDGSQAAREVVEHADSVAIVALDDDGRVLLIRQYRHPAGRLLWELPAGLRDESGEDPLHTAQRELAEETGLRAGSWSTLVDLRPSPGMSTEVVRVYRAEQLRQEERQGEAEDEERGIQTRWVRLDDAVREVLAGDITNALAVAGLLAAVVRNGDRFPGDRPGTAPWPDGHG